MPRQLKDATVVVLGGSSGIGLATAQAVLSEGAAVVIGSRSRANLDAARERLRDLVAAYEVDMTDEASVEGFFDRIDSVDHLFIPAAELPGGNVRTTDATSLRPAIDSRFWGSFYATKYAIPRLAQSGSITYCSGISTVKAFPGEAVVAASCAAVESLARTLAVELAPIRVNTICPGVIDTSLLAKYWGDRLEEVRETFAQTLPVKRLGRPEDVAHAVVFLMENEFVTGTVLYVDGGHAVI